MRLSTVALTLAFALGVAGFVAADEPETSWFSRTFPLPWAKAPVDAEKSKKDDLPVPPIPSGPSLRQRQAKMDAALARRREVCLRLEEIAAELHDEGLARKAEELNQRAWDVYVAAMERIRSPDVPSEEPDGKKKGGRK